MANEYPIKFKNKHLKLPYDFRNKVNNADHYIRQLANRTASMFEWDGLPDTVPQRDLELMLQGNGSVAWHKVRDELYVFVGGLGGNSYSPYFDPTWMMTANPALNWNGKITFGKDGVLMNNDTMREGLLPLFEKYSSLLAENDLTLWKTIINARMPMMVVANNDRTFKSVMKLKEDIEIGNDLLVRGSLADENAISTLPYSADAAATLSNLIEIHQYLKASLYNDLGLNANYNMKRESLNSSESQMNFDALLPLVDDMLTQRQNALKEVNEMFGTNISVKFNSAWEDEQLKLNSLDELNDVNLMEGDETVEVEKEVEENVDTTERNDE